MGKKEVNIKDLKFGPMLREELSPVLEKWANSIHKSLGDELIGPYERFEANFCRDKNPAKELFVWQTIASTLQAYEEKVTCNRLEVFKQLLSFTVGGNVEDSQLSSKKISSLKKLMMETQKTLLDQWKKAIIQNGATDNGTNNI